MELEVSSNTYWNVTTDSDWITIRGETSGLQDGVLEIEIAPALELANSRSGFVLVGDQSVILTQNVALSIPDPVLEAALRVELGRPDGPIRDVDLEDLVSLDIDGPGAESDSGKLHDLSGLEYAINLKWLFLDDTLITSLEPLRGLESLTNLYIENTPWDEGLNLDILTHLETLLIQSCGLEEIPSIPVGVVELFLGDNRISDLHPLENETQLERLGLEYNRIVDTSPLTDLVGLHDLWLEGNLIREASPLAGLDQLEQLQIHGNHLTSIRFFESLSGLTTLTLSYNYIDFSEGSDELQLLNDLQNRGVSVGRFDQYIPQPNVLNSRYEVANISNELLIEFSYGTYWTAEAKVSWVTLVQNEGFGSGPLEVSIASNEGLDSRIGEVEIDGVLLGITQAGITPDASLAESSLSIGYSGGELVIDVTATTPWRATFDGGWIQVPAGDRDGSGSLVITVLRNHSAEEREATIDFGSASLVIKQSKNSSYLSYALSQGHDIGLNINLPDGDADGDGMSNAEEFSYGVDPFDADSSYAFRFSMERTVDGAVCVIRMSPVLEDVSRIIEYTKDLREWNLFEPDREEMDEGLVILYDSLSADEVLSPRFYRQRFIRE